MRHPSWYVGTFADTIVRGRPPLSGKVAVILLSVVKAYSHNVLQSIMLIIGDVCTTAPCAQADAEKQSVPADAC